MIMAIGRKFWNWNLKATPLYWFAQGKYKKGIGIYGLWLAAWMILFLAITKPRNKNASKFKATNRKKEVNA